jgi:hypothetical protein
MFLGKSAVPFPTEAETQTTVSVPAKPATSGIALLLNIVGVLALVFGLYVFLNSKSAVHEIEAGIAMLCFISAIGAAGIITELRSRE